MIERVAVVIPAHDEQQLLGGCLAALREAATQVPVPVDLVVVLDDCRDRTREIACAAGVSVVTGAWRNVGCARAAGFGSVLADGVRADADWLVRRTLWLASTDADTCVAPDWIRQQLRCEAEGADAVLGVVDVDDWSGHSTDVPQRFAELYAHDETPVHGASLGLRMSAYLRVGGLRPLRVGEDRDLAGRLAATRGLTVVSDHRVRATTSARRTPRVVGGFGTLLAELT